MSLNKKFKYIYKIGVKPKEHFLLYVCLLFVLFFFIVRFAWVVNIKRLIDSFFLLF